ncbi:small acid-soluble spore protein SspI [Paenibacillus aurantius]|uniref:Small, acid-soluble spore protein I n=1 Tax=Paenibacillus aurantius TaxID=2918900 RepID=A0AA96LI29_9BACL|nr:small acid-soluble spore protein SspI [Paenibacillus aurantius]WNQ12515.1 small acid-soluble spore protein SspI [Paenibacillus aurantius]
MMLSLRQAIVKRVEGKNAEELREVIEDSIRGDEKALPGLGVLFEFIWENTSPETRDELVQNLMKGLPEAPAATS